MGKYYTKNSYSPVSRIQHIGAQTEERNPKSSRRKSLRPKPLRWKSSRRKLLQPKPSSNTRQRTRRRKPQKIQHVTATKTRYVPSEEIQQRIQREIIRQEKEKRG